MIVYVHNKCSTCKNALSFLERHHKTATIRDITINPPTLSELRQMLHYQNGNIRKLFNTSGLLYRELQLSDKIDCMSESEALQLLSQHGMLVKRPFLLGKDFGLVGFKEDQWTSAL